MRLFCLCEITHFMPTCFKFAGPLVFVALLGGCAHAAALSDFTTDGCSLFPDGTIADRTLWCDCCLQHDIAYWQGGTEAQRLQADEQLKTCVAAKTHDPVLAQTMFLGVRAGGQPVFPNWYRWGYGWPYGRGYTALSAEEQMQVQKKLAQRSEVAQGGYCAHN